MGNLFKDLLLDNPDVMSTNMVTDRIFFLCTGPQRLHPGWIERLSGKLLELHHVN